MSVNPDSGAGDPSKVLALQCIEEVIEACPFPALANDWGLAEIKCCAMNNHYTESKKCPKEYLLGKNNRVLDPTHLTSLPGKVRLGIRAAMSYGRPYNQHFASVKTTEPEREFMKSITMRTVCLDGHRFIIGLQRTSGDHSAMTITFRGDPVYRGTMKEWWAKVEELALDSATRSGLTVAWISAHEASKWEVQTDGIFEQTDHFVQKEQLDQALIQVVESFEHPALLLDPFLPECPVIGLNRAAQALTGWKDISNVASADKILEQVRFSGGAGNAYHVNYGAYTKEEDEERLAVRTACTNGRPCVATFRDMYAFPSKAPVFLKMQGVTLCQGAVSGPLSGGDVWYLVALLGTEASSTQVWAESEAMDQKWTSLSHSVGKVIADPAAILTMPMPPEDEPHPYGGMVSLVRLPLWHRPIELLTRAVSC